MSYCVKIHHVMFLIIRLISVCYSVTTNGINKEIA